ncbi:ABC transporter substrate-binding protein [Salibacterium salarium]|uniref:ABC transporter substrate-binding protein n=1 Tax=Salibacterium salarium TaxID=284579 RepID=A0A3R9QPI7_9BACI|nr:ABC transporter substrate-binding protein [Salibacterium salarium]RSL30485.1 ABC transporter substrate-binding protein [Salibacterium salarium]
MKKKQLWIWSLFVLMMMFVIAGCSSEGSGADGDSGDDNASENNTQDTLVFGRGADSTSLDPATETDGETFYVTQQIYDTLIQYKPGTTELEPALAEDWESSDDGTEFTLTLREGVSFHDGTEFTADAVVANFERWMQSEDFIYYGSMFGGYGDDEDNIIENVEATGDYEVMFSLRAPSAPFLKNLAMSPFAIASPNSFDTLEEDPVGTGPFTLESWSRNDSITLNKNEDYWEDGKPHLHSLIFQVIPDNSSRLTALQNGEIDLMDGVNPSDQSQIENDDNLKTFMRPPLNVAYMPMNNEVEPFDDPVVRQAVNHAINKEALIEGFYEGNAEPAKNMLPPTVNGYNDDVEGYEFDPEQAIELLEDADYAEGELTIDLWTMDNPRPYMPAPQKIAESIQNDLSDVGIEANIQTLDWSTYLENAQNGEMPTFLIGWIGDNGDADNFLYTLLGTGSGNNYSFYSNEEVDSVLQEAQAETDEDKRADLYQEAQELINEDAPTVPLVHYESIMAGSNTLDGYTPAPTGSERFTDVKFTE